MGSFILFLVIVGAILLLTFLKSKAASRRAPNAALQRALKRAHAVWDNADMEKRTLLLKSATEIQGEKVLLASVHVQWAQLPEHVRTKLAAIVLVYEETPEILRNTATSTAHSSGGRAQTDEFDNSDYGPADMPPSPDAQSIRDQMTTTDKSTFDEFLARFQWEQQKKHGDRGMALHPEARACVWGLSFFKIADVHRAAQDSQGALYYTLAAWETSRYPIYANNAALLCIAAGDNSRAKELLLAFVDQYKASLRNSVFKMVMGDGIPPQVLENVAVSARKRISAIDEGRNPMAV